MKTAKLEYRGTSYGSHSLTEGRHDSINFKGKKVHIFQKKSLFSRIGYLLKRIFGGWKQAVLTVNGQKRDILIRCENIKQIKNAEIGRLRAKNQKLKVEIARLRGRVPEPESTPLPNGEGTLACQGELQVTVKGRKTTSSFYEKDNINSLDKAKPYNKLIETLANEYDLKGPFIVYTGYTGSVRIESFADADDTNLNALVEAANRKGAKTVVISLLRYGETSMYTQRDITDANPFIKRLKDSGLTVICIQPRYTESRGLICASGNDNNRVVTPADMHTHVSIDRA